MDLTGHHRCTVISDLEPAVKEVARLTGRQRCCRTGEAGTCGMISCRPSCEGSVWIKLHDEKEEWSLKASSKTQGPRGGHVKATYYLASRRSAPVKAEEVERKGPR